MQHLQSNTTLQGGKYKIERVLGQGGFGITYLARNTVFDIDVAVKEFFMKDENERDGNSVTMPNSTKTELFAGQKEKFKKEAKRMFAIKNEHIIGVQDLFEENGTAYYVMDYVDGENLAERLKRTGKPMSEQEVRELLPQILDALKSVHDAGIWHLDLKPANIMLEKGGNVKLIDFGASKQLNAQKGGATTSTAISYTNGYAPREQMEQNYDKFGPWTDIYALGATLYNLLTNKRPPLPTDIDDDISEDKHVALPFPESVGGMKYLVLQMMKTNRLQRPQSIDAIDIEKIQELSSASESRYTQNSHWVESPLSTDEEGENTIIDNSHHTKKEEKNKAEERPKASPQPESTAFVESQYGQDSDDNSTNIWKAIGGIAVFVIIGYFLILPKGDVDSSQEPNSPQKESKEPRTVGNIRYQTAIGSCLYGGPVDENDKPHGIGEAFFSDGRYYYGAFEHGIMTGEDCHFEYANGDTFRGEFRNNSFYYGRYTIAKDQSYFYGYYSNGQPSKGIWYDKNGKVIDNI